MAKQLPVVNSPTLVCTLPVSGNKVKYRPFIVKEQKALLLAQQSEDEDTLANTVRSVIESCTNGTLDYDNSPTADIAYFFLQLRIAAVGSEVRFSMPCIQCDEPVPIGMDLSAVNVDMSNSQTSVMLTDTIGVQFRYPTLSDSFVLDKTDRSVQSITMIKRLIVSVFDEDQVYPKEDYDDGVLEEWIYSLNDAQLQRIQHFVDHIPELTHKLDFTCPKCQAQQSRLLEGLHTFFRLGNDA